MTSWKVKEHAISDRQNERLARLRSKARKTGHNMAADMTMREMFQNIIRFKQEEE